MWGHKKRIYLDSAAGIAANPSSPHAEGRHARSILENARTAIARLLEVQGDDVIFTSGATESNALAILGHIRAMRLRAGPMAAGRNHMHVLYLPSSHASIIENMKILEKEGVKIEPLPIHDYKIDIEALAGLLRDETALVSMDAVCGETGTVWNTREVADVLRRARRAEEPRIVLHVDASQAPLTEKLTRDHFGADLLSLDASKVGDVRGIGALVAHRTIPIEPLYRGGGQERGLRSGTESPELASRFAAALTQAAHGREAFHTSAEENRTLLVKNITQGIPDVQIQESRLHAPHILSISLPGRDTDYLVALMDEAGFAVATKSACETDSEEGSRAVLALTGDIDRARATLRISWNPATSARDLTAFSDELSRAVAFIDTGIQR